MNQLLQKVEQTRSLMVKSGLQYGLLDAKTINLSKRLDELLNLYSETCSETCEKNKLELHK